MENDIPHKYLFFCESELWYAAVVKLVHIQRNQIFSDEKCLEHYHIQDITGKHYDMQLVAIELG
jgi:hypothetical protein